MFVASRASFNFYPLGRRAGPVNAFERYGNHNNVIARTWRPPGHSVVKRVIRPRMQLSCPMCSFRWDHDTLCVHCPAVHEHNSREHNLAPNWFFKGEQPFRYYRSMKVTRNPRTGQLMADGFAKANNNERRMQGLTTRVRMLAKEQRGMSIEQSGIGSFSNHWLTHFPYPG